jgi:predicted nuclease with TOPRIM domain
MSNSSVELDSAKLILTTYRQVHDTPDANRSLRLKSQQKNKELREELHRLKEKYGFLQNELHNRDKRLSNLNKELMDKSAYIMRLQEDFENAIRQLAQRKDLSP